MSDSLDLSRKKIVVDWLLPAENKLAERVKTTFNTLSNTNFPDSDTRLYSDEQKKYNNALGVYEAVNRQRVSLDNKLNVYGYDGHGFMETVYQAIRSLQLLPSGLFDDDNKLGGTELIEGRQKLLAFFETYINGEGAQYLDLQMYNVPKGKDSATYSYRQAFQDIESTSDIELKSHSALSNPIGWWGQQSNRQKAQIKVVGGISLLVLIAVLAQLGLKNVKS